MMIVLLVSPPCLNLLAFSGGSITLGTILTGVLGFGAGIGSTLFRVAFNKIKYSCSFVRASHWLLHLKKCTISIIQFFQPPFSLMIEYNLHLWLFDFGLIQLCL
jgi:hypothetical protein